MSSPAGNDNGHFVLLFIQTFPGCRLPNKKRKKYIGFQFQLRSFILLTAVGPEVLLSPLNNGDWGWRGFVLRQGICGEGVGKNRPMRVNLGRCFMSSDSGDLCWKGDGGRVFVQGGGDLRGLSSKSNIIEQPSNFPLAV